MPGTANSGGRNKKSARQHKLEGTFQKVRHAGDVTPQAPKGVPTSPKPLQGDALAEWDRMVADMQALGTASAVDGHALYQYCQLFAETEAIAVTQAEIAATIDLLEENLSGPKEEREDLLGVVQEIAKLRVLQSGCITKIRQGRMACRQYLVEFGMTPSARTRVKVPDTGPKKDPFAEFDPGGSVQ